MISLNQLNYSYGGQPLLFENQTLTIRAGAIVGLLGKNGSGKTSLLKLINGLLFPENGELKVLGYHPKSRLPAFLKNIYFIPEEFYLPPVTIDQYIHANCSFYPTFDHELMGRLLDITELSPADSIHRISFGQKKKFLITFALSTKCKLLLLDEPTNGLDIPSKAVFRKIVAGSLDDDQLVIISTHQVKDIETLIDRVIILDEGQVVLNKALHEISSQWQFTRTTALDKTKVIYSEAVPEGYHVISPQVNGDSLIDMELLFNAVTTGKQTF